MNKLIYVVLLGVLLMGRVGASDVNSLVESGNKYWAEGKLEQAESTFREAARLDPDAALPQSRLAGLLLSQQRNDEARTAYQAAIINDPENPALFLALAIVYLHGKSYSEAQAMVDVALELDPDMENALKMQEYMEVKTASIEQAAAVSTDSSPAVPQDATHGSAVTGAEASQH